MSDSILNIKNITKSYRKNVVVDNFSLSIKRGHICGLIGRNGAGKTTIMKIIAGLTKADSGSLEFFGDTNLDEQRKRMSFIIENPVIDPNMTAIQNLEYIRYMRGTADKKRINEVLELTNISNTKDKKVGKFSLGMKQRLAISIALLSSPEIMILDEPVNGLDPEGIIDVRNILKRICKEQNVTILISSHILSELAELCTDFAIINNGKLIEQLSIKELTQKCRNRITLKTNNTDRTAVLLEEKLNIKNYTVMYNSEIYIFEQTDEIEKISKTITDNGVVITKLTLEGESLEEYYLSKVGDVQ